MPDTATQYLAEETTKAVGKLIKNLEQLLEDCKHINADAIAERFPDQIALYHKAFTGLVRNTSDAAMVTTIARIMSKPQNDEDSSTTE